MPSDYKREVPIRLDRTHHLRFTTNSFVIIERETGKSFDDYLTALSKADEHPDEMKFQFIQKVLNWEVLRVMIWVGLLHEDKNLTLEQAGEWMDQAEGEDSMQQYCYLYAKVLEAWAATKPKLVKKNIMVLVDALQKLQEAIQQAGVTGDLISSPQPSTESPSAISGK